MNTIQLIGRLTKDPVKNQTKGGTTVATMRLAVPRPPRGGEEQGSVFVDVTVYGTTAEAVAGYVGKGRQVAVTGRLEFDQWTDADGNPHSRHSVVADQVDFLARPAHRDAEPAEAANAA